MLETVHHVKITSKLHEILGYTKPNHPLITMINASAISVPREMLGSKHIADLFQIALQDKKCGFEYGRNSHDFEEGVLMFAARGQAVTMTQEMKKSGHADWMLFFHPDLIRRFHLGREIAGFSFLAYDVHEALHLPYDEELILTDIVEKIRKEYSERINRHSHKVIVSSSGLNLSYSLRFYERQDNTRTAGHKDIVGQFELNVKAYFYDSRHLSEGLQGLKYFADLAHLSLRYFSVLLKKDTRRRTKDHIKDFVIKRAKDFLLGRHRCISEIVNDLGFNYPHYFSRLFKTRTGSTPLTYRDYN